MLNFTKRPVGNLEFLNVNEDKILFTHRKMIDLLVAQSEHAFNGRAAYNATSSAVSSAACGATGGAASGYGVSSFDGKPIESAFGRLEYLFSGIPFVLWGGSNAPCLSK